MGDGETHRRCEFWECSGETRPEFALRVFLAGDPIPVSDFRRVLVDLEPPLCDHTILTEAMAVFFSTSESPELIVQVDGAGQWITCVDVDAYLARIRAEDAFVRLRGAYLEDS